jgi:hypothetical protein
LLLEQQAVPPLDRQAIISKEIELLQAIAEKFFSGEEISRSELNRFLDGWAERLSLLHPLAFQVQMKRGLLNVLLEDGVLVSAGPQSFMFVHLTLQEYLVARARPTAAGRRLQLKSAAWPGSLPGRK